MLQQIAVTDIAIAVINCRSITVTKRFVIMKLILCEEQTSMYSEDFASLYYQTWDQGICFLHGIVYFCTFLIMPEI